MNRPSRPSTAPKKQRKQRLGQHPQCYGHYLQAKDCRNCAWLARCCDLQLLNE